MSKKLAALGRKNFFTCVFFVMPPCDVSSRRLDLVTRASDAREGTSALCDARATRRGRRGRVAREEKSRASNRASFERRAAARATRGRARWGALKRRFSAPDPASGGASGVARATSKTRKRRKESGYEFF